MATDSNQHSVSDLAATRLLRLCADVGSGPLAELQRLVSGTPGPGVVLEGVHSITGRQPPFSGATLEDLRRFKEMGRDLSENSTPERRAAHVLTYFLAVAAALADHGVNISSRSTDELEPLLLDIALMFDDPIRSHVSRAVDDR